MLSVRLAAFGVGRTWDYDISQVRGLRVSPHPWGSRSQWAGSISFDYGARTIRCGRDVDEAEASMIIADLVKTGFLPESRRDA